MVGPNPVAPAGAPAAPAQANPAQVHEVERVLSTLQRWGLQREGSMLSAVRNIVPGLRTVESLISALRSFMQTGADGLKADLVAEFNAVCDITRLMDDLEGRIAALNDQHDSNAVSLQEWLTKEWSDLQDDLDAHKRSFEFYFDLHELAVRTNTPLPDNFWASPVVRDFLAQR